MGLIQSFYEKITGKWCSIRNSTFAITPIKVCCECDKEIEAYVAREFDGKVNKYYCDWACFHKNIRESSLKRRRNITQEISEQIPPPSVTVDIPQESMSRNDLETIPL